MKLLFDTMSLVRAPCLILFLAVGTLFGGISGLGFRGVAGGAIRRLSGGASSMRYVR